MRCASSVAVAVLVGLLLAPQALAEGVLDAGGKHTCAVETNGAPVCWGGDGASAILSDSLLRRSDGEPRTLRPRWLRCTDKTVASCSPIPGGTDWTYVLTDDDDARRIRLRVSTTNDVGTSSPSMSKATGLIDIPTSKVRPAFTGGTATGSLLTTGHGEWIDGQAGALVAAVCVRAGDAGNDQLLSSYSRGGGGRSTRRTM